MTFARRACLALVLLAPAGLAAAHEGSTGYLEIAAGKDGLAGRLDVALIDLAWSLPLDRDADGRLSWNEVWDERERIAVLVARGLQFERGGAGCTTGVGEPWLVDRLGQSYVSVDVSARCQRDGPARIQSSLFFDGDASHRLLISLTSNGAAQLGTLSPASRAWSQPEAHSAWQTALAFLGQGIWHVLIGYDHLLFLLVLMLPAAALRELGAPGRGRAAALDLARVVTAFTVAHSVTLGLAATGAVQLPQRPVEAAIAVSIVIAGLLNLAPRSLRLRLPVAFGFGLLHGFGFANALAGLAADGIPLAALAGFNVGVELANLAAIAVALPLLLVLGRRAWYASRALPVLSLASAMAGGAWLLQRL